MGHSKYPPYVLYDGAVPGASLPILNASTTPVPSKTVAIELVASVLGSLELVALPDVILFPLNGHQMCIVSTAYAFETGDR